MRQVRDYWHVMSEARDAARRIGYRGELLELVVFALRGLS